MFDLTQDFAPVPLQQSQEYLRALDSFGVQTEALVFARKNAVLGHAIMQVQWWPVVGWIGLISRGPTWDSICDPDALRATLQALPHPVVVNADGMDADALHGIGMIPLMTRTATAVWDIRGDAEARRAGMHQKWRNRLHKSERMGLRIRQAPLPPTPDHWLLKREAVQRKTRGYRGLPGLLAAHYAEKNPDAAQVFWVERYGAPVAGMIFLRHGRGVTYFLGYSDEEGRACHAHNMLMTAAGDWFADRGAVQIDLGALNTVNAPGLARFKLGCGARPYVLGGTWLYSKRLSAIKRAVF